MVSTLRVSLEPHLVDALRPLVPLVPEHLATQLDPILRAPPAELPAGEEPETRLIPYSLLHDLSKWSRTPEGELALKQHEPSLSPQDYSIVALLAGTRTSPDRTFPDYAPAPDPLAVRRKEINDRRALTAVANSLLSIGGAGVAVWWAAGRLAWKEEWRVLFALAVAIVVAASEAILFLIWESRKNRTPRARSAARRRRGSVHVDDTGAPADDDGAEEKRAEDDALADSDTGETRAGPDDVARTTARADGIREGGLRERTAAAVRAGEQLRDVAWTGDQ